VVSAADAEPRTWSTLPVHGGEAQRSQPESTALIYLASSASAQRPKEIGQHRRRPLPRSTHSASGGRHGSGLMHASRKRQAPFSPTSQMRWPPKLSAVMRRRTTPASTRLPFVVVCALQQWGTTRCPHVSRETLDRRNQHSAPWV